MIPRLVYHMICTYRSALTITSHDTHMIPRSAPTITSHDTHMIPRSAPTINIAENTTVATSTKAPMAINIQTRLWACIYFCNMV